MALDLVPISQQHVPAGTVLFDAGSQAQMLCLLHQGEVTAQSRFDHKPPRKRLYTMGNNSAPGFASLLMSQSYSSTLVATRDSTISAFPVKGDFTRLILGKLNVGMIAVRSLLQENINTYNTIKKYSAYLSMLQKCNDNLSIAYFKSNPNVFNTDVPAMGGELLDPVIPAARFTVQEFNQNGGEIPDVVTPEWLQGNHSGLLKRNYEYESDFDTDEFNFLRRLLQLPMELQGNIFKTDLNILHGLSLKLSRTLSSNVQELYLLQDSVDQGLEIFCSGEYCFVEKFHLLSDVINEGLAGVPINEFVNILKFIIGASSSLLKNYAGLTGVPYSSSTESLQKIQSFLTDSNSVKKVEEEKAQVAQSAQVGMNIEAIKNELASSPGKILSFVGIPADESKAMLEDLKILREMQNPLDSGGDPRKLRRKISKTYWAAYEKAYYKSQESRGNVPKPVRMMLDFGYFDSDMLTDEQLGDLYNLSDDTRPNPKYPTIRAEDWLTLVAQNKELPSIDEMGESYFNRLKMENKDKGWKRPTDVPEEYDNAQTRVAHELKNFLETNVRLTSGSPTTAFPILTKYQIILPVEKSFVTMGKLAETLDKLLATDFSAFHREVLINDEEKGIFKEFVQHQVIPNFILVPSIGTKIMMWQDVSGRSKSSMGRIAVPIFATADLYTLLLEAVAAFRWELTKTIMGPDWNNVSQPSITADYTDYVQFYKKNRDLTPEMKEKLSAEFKRFRDDRARFVNDYTTWLKFESEGVLKLNKVSRGILYRHIPFHKDIRDRLANQPAFADLQNRFKNIRTKKIKEIEVRYRKYGEVLPDVLQNNMDFFKV